MTDDRLADELRALGRSAVVPPVAAGLTAAVLERIAEPGRRSFAARLRSRWKALVAGLLVLVGGLALAPPVRATVIDWLGLGGVVVRQVPGGPSTAPEPPPAGGGLSLTEAAARVGFTPVVPAQLGAPDAVDVSPDRRILAMSWRTGEGTVRLEQFAGRVSMTYVKEISGQLEFLRLGGGTAYWFRSPHKLVLIDAKGVERTEQARTAGPTLVWEYGDSVTLRLEGIPQSDRALAVAESAVPR